MRERGRKGRRRLAVSGLVVALLVVVAMGTYASFARDAEPVLDPVQAASDPVAAASVLGAPAAEAIRPVPRWWFTPWPNTAAPTFDRAGEVVEVPPDAASSGTSRPRSAAPFADQDDVLVEESDIVALRTVEGFEVAAGGAAFGDGPQVTFTVEVEPAVGEDLLAVTAAVEEALGDPRSWARDRRFVRVDDPAAASVRVVVATPATVDRLCGAVGLNTVGRYSCWTGRFAALNSWRWAEGATAFDDLTTYRRYLVNHEVGHALGYGHVGCPQPGALAPVMMQQSISTGACLANGWPYP